MQVIPFARGTAGQAAYGGIGAIGRDEQRRTQLAAIGEGQQPVVTTATQLFQARAGQQADLAVVQALEQGVLYHAVLDDMPQRLGMHAGRSEMDAAGAGAIPHAHLAVGAGPSGGDAVPGAQALQDALAGHGQGTDPWLERRLCDEGRHAERAAIDDQDVQPTVLQRQGQRTAHHAGADDDQIRAHIIP